MVNIFMPLFISQENKKKRPFYVKKFGILIILLALIILVPGYLFLAKPQYISYQKNKVLNNRFKQELEHNIKELLSYKKIFSSYEQINPFEEEQLNQILPSQIDDSSLYVNLDALVKQAGIVLDSIDIRQVDSGDNNKKSKSSKKQPKTTTQAPIPEGLKGTLETVEIKLSLSEVSYSKIKNLLDLLEINLRLFDVQSFDFNAADSSLDLLLHTYYIQ